MIDRRLPHRFSSSRGGGRHVPSSPARSPMQLAAALRPQRFRLLSPGARRVPVDRLDDSARRRTAAPLPARWLRPQSLLL